MVSWDLLVFRVPDGVVSFGELGNDFDVADDPLGVREVVVGRIRDVAPMVDFSDQRWGVIDDSRCVMELNMGNEDPIESIMLHVRGGHDAPGVIAALLTGLDCQAFDLQTGEFFDTSTAEASFVTWSAYRDRVLRQGRG